MQLNTITILALYLLPSNAEGTVPASGPTLKVGSVASQLKEAASQSFLRTRGGNEEAPTKTGMGDEVQDVHEAEDAEELKESSSGAVAEYDDMHETTNSSDMWAYERENDDGEVLAGTDPFENHTVQSLEESDFEEPEQFEQEEDEVPPEWEDPTNSTDEWAYEKANDDGTVLYGTNPLLAQGFVWEQDDLNDEDQPQEANSDEKQDEEEEQQDEDAAQSKNQVVLHAGTDEMPQDKQDDEWVTGEETDDGTVLYGTNPLENQSDDDEDEEDDMESKLDHEDTDDMEYNPDHAVALKANSTVNSTHDDEEEEYDDGSLDYGTNPMDMPDDEDDDDDSNGAYDVAGLNSTGTDNEPEEYDDGTVLYGTNPLEPSDEEESNEQDVTPSSKTKALPAPTPSQNVSKEATAQMAV